MAGSIRFEKENKPVAYVVADHFIHDARSSAEDNGMPGLRILGVPADKYFKMRIDKQEVKKLAKAIFDEIIQALTQPLSAEELHPTFKSRRPTTNINIPADSYDGALEIFNQQFIDNHWGSGLPLMPPTPERVHWILSGTKLSPDEVIGQIAPKNGIATVEKIAINAAMAGAKPEYLPVIIAVIRAVTDRRFDLLHMTASTGSFTLQIMVNGPIGEEIGINSGMGLVGYGWRANNTIGHAVRLCLINLGHAWPTENDMALIGRPSSHTFNVFAENEKQSPWHPYHTLKGYDSDTNCVTVSTFMPYASHMSGNGTTFLGGGAVEPWTAETILDNMVAFTLGSRSQMKNWKLKTVFPCPPHYFFILFPDLAVELNKLGFDQKGIQKHLFENASVSFDDLSREEKDSVKRRINDGEIPVQSIPYYKDQMKKGGCVPLLLTPEDCHIAVAGGIPGYAFVNRYFSIPPYAETSVITKEII